MAQQANGQGQISEIHEAPFRHLTEENDLSRKFNVI